MGASYRPRINFSKFGVCMEDRLEGGSSMQTQKFLTADPGGKFSSPQTQFTAKVPHRRPKVLNLEIGLIRADPK